MGADPAELAGLLDAVRPRTDKPLIVKLTPNCASPADVAAAAEAARRRRRVADQHAARDGDATRDRPGEPWLGGGTGGVSGPAVRAIALSQVREVRAARRRSPSSAWVGSSLDATRNDLREAGADLVGVGTESFRDPLAAGRIAAEVSRAEEGFPANAARAATAVARLSTRCASKALQSTLLPSTPLHAASPQLEVEANSCPTRLSTRENGCRLAAHAARDQDARQAHRGCP